MKTLATAVSAPEPPDTLSFQAHDPQEVPELIAAEPSNAARARLAAFIALTKPRIVWMVLITVFVGYVLGARKATYPTALLLTLVGTGLVAAAGSVWNQYLERDRDRRMRRTSSRPLPSGQVEPLEAAAFGSLLGVLGLAILALCIGWLATSVALVTFILYAFVYTLLKPVTTLNTAVGAIPGALPPVIGWSAATGQLGIEALALFLIVYLWQFPHFLAIAWVHRTDYARAGYKMLPRFDPTGHQTARQAFYHALALIPVGLVPVTIGLAGSLYFVGALALGVYYSRAAARFWLEVNDTSARRLLKASFLYLPLILLLLLLNPLPA